MGNWGLKYNKTNFPAMEQFKAENQKQEPILEKDGKGEQLLQPENQGDEDTVIQSFTRINSQQQEAIAKGQQKTKASHLTLMPVQFEEKKTDFERRRRIKVGQQQRLLQQLNGSLKERKLFFVKVVNLARFVKLKNLVVLYWHKLWGKHKPLFGKHDIFYIGSGETLPAPLTSIEEADLMTRLSAGDLEVRSTLIEHNLRLVVYIARKFENTGIGIEDLASIGTIGLIKAVNTFDPEKKIKLATYASRCIENEILMCLRRNSKIKTEVSFDEPLNIDWDGNELLLSDVLGTESDIIYKEIEEEVDKKLLQVAIGKLLPRERRIMELRFGLGGIEERTQKEVADLLGISQSYISRLEKRIIGRLKKEICKLE